MKLFSALILLLCQQQSCVVVVDADIDDGDTPTICPANFDPVWCEGNEYSNKCFAKAAGFVKSHCTDGDIFCLAVVEQVWCQGNINTAIVEYSNLCLATAVGFKKSQCTDEDPDVKDTLDDECEDDENFRKGRKGNKKKKKNCAAYLQKNGERRCNKNHKGGKVYDFCVKTCNEFGLGDCGVFGLD